MNEPSAMLNQAALMADLQDYHALCEEVLELDAREGRALDAEAEYQPFEYYQARKNLLSRLQNSHTLLRKWRLAWQQISPSERIRHPDVRSKLQTMQSVLMKILVIERENQQALLQRGLVPPAHLPAHAGQQPGFVAGLYRRHAAS